MLRNCPDAEFVFNATESGLYEACIIGASFTKDELEIKDSKSFQLVLKLSVDNDGIIEKKDASYSVSVKGYKSFVMPT